MKTAQCDAIVGSFWNYPNELQQFSSSGRCSCDPSAVRAVAGAAVLALVLP